ncbi:unnamed protein product [Boreogadus saida]
MPTGRLPWEKCVSMGPLAVSRSAVTRDRPAVASTHHGTTTVSSQKSSPQMNLHLRGPSNNQPTTIHHPLSRVPPRSIQTLDSNLSHSQPPQGHNHPPDAQVSPVAWRKAKSND